VLLKLIVLQTIEERYGQDAAWDCLNSSTKQLVQILNSNDKLFHWDRDVIMAIVKRQFSQEAMRKEFNCVIASKGELVGGTDSLELPCVFASSNP